MDGLDKGIARRHDLDALRAFAMLSGIGLHAALSLTGYPWVVQDLRPSGVFLGLFAAIHGARMPLFMLVSGFFTMMLWRRRGMKSLLRQRFWRVFVPCMIGLATVVPALGLASGLAGKMARSQDARREAAPSTASGVVESLRARDLAGLGKALDAGADLDAVDAEFGLPPLAWAAVVGDLPAATLLMDRGADVNRSDRSGYRPLHTASFAGRSEVAALLIRRGADPKAKGPRGDTAVESTRADPGMSRAIFNGLRVHAPDEADLEAGRARCRGLLGVDPAGESARPAGPSWSLESARRAYAAALTSDVFLVRLGPNSAPFHLFLTPVFHHLWFLWFLCWLVLGFAAVAPMASRLAPGERVARRVVSPLRWLWVVPLAMVPQSLMGALGPGFGPDTSAGLLPYPHLLLYYAVFFGFGAIYYDADDRDGRLGRHWWLTIPVALVVLLPLGLVASGSAWIGGLAQVAYAWAMTFGLIGLFRRTLSVENRTIRYLSDSAYWLYLAHLPLLILAQAWVRDRDWPAGLKFAFMVAAVTLPLLGVYQVAVRHTWIGRLLNGPRGRRAVAVEAGGSQAP